MGSLFLLGLRALGEIYFNNVAHLASYWMSDFMSSQVASFEDLNISINLTETKTDFLEKYCPRDTQRVPPIEPFHSERHSPMELVQKRETSSDSQGFSKVWAGEADF
jgi:hypothetical protein